MFLIKKLLFSVPFLIFFYWFNFSMSPYFKDIYLLFGVSIDLLINLLILSFILILSSIFFIIFVSIAFDSNSPLANSKIVLPVILVASVCPLILFSQPVNLILAAGYSISFCLGLINQNDKLSKYLTFEPNSLISPSVKSITFLVILACSFAFYLVANQQVKNKGFEIPDQLIETSLKLVNPADVKGVKIAQVPGITQEQIEFLKKNPDLLKQYGIDPSTLDSLDQNRSSESTPKPKAAQNSSPSPSLSNDILKSLVKSQFQKLIEPYLGILPVILAFIFFLTFQTLVSVLSIFNPFLINTIFYFLEKSKIIKYQKEMKEVKRLTL